MDERVRELLSDGLNAEDICVCGFSEHSDVFVSEIIVWKIVHVGRLFFLN